MTTRFPRGDDAPRSSPRTRARPAILFGLLCVAAVLVSVVSTEIAPPPPFVVVCGALILGAKVVLDRASTRARAPFLPVATSIAVTFIAALLAAHQWDLVATQIDQLHHTRHLAVGEHLYGQGRASFLFLGALPLTGMVGLTAGTALTRLARSSRFARGVGALAAFSSLSWMSLVALSLVRVASRPSFEDYLVNLEMVGSVAPPGVVTSFRYVSGPTPAEWGPGAIGIRRQDIGGLTVVQQCEASGCRLGVADRTGPEPEPSDLAFQPWNTSVWLARDRVTDTLFVLRGHGASREKRAVAELHHRDGRWVAEPFDRDHIASRSRPPLSWILGSAAGLLLLLPWVAARLWGERRRREPEQARQGTSGADISGAPAEPEVAAAHQSLRYDSAILAVAALSLAPLLGAALAGLVVGVSPVRGRGASRDVDIDGRAGDLEPPCILRRNELLLGPHRKGDSH